jgi:hypothetical protein
MLVRVYPSEILKEKREGKKGYVVSTRDIFIHTEKVILDGEEIELGENDEVVVDVDMIRIIDERFDSERDILVCSKIRLVTRTFNLASAIQEVLGDTVIRIAHVE